MQGGGGERGSGAAHPTGGPGGGVKGMECMQDAGVGRQRCAASARAKHDRAEPQGLLSRFVDGGAQKAAATMTPAIARRSPMRVPIPLNTLMRHAFGRRAVNEACTQTTRTPHASPSTRSALAGRTRASNPAVRMMSASLTLMRGMIQFLRNNGPHRQGRIACRTRRGARPGGGGVWCPRIGLHHPTCRANAKKGA